MAIRKPSRIASARPIEKSYVVESNAFELPRIMKSRTVAALVALSVAAGVAHADPYAINQVTAGSTNYAFFIIKAKKIRGTMIWKSVLIASSPRRQTRRS